MRIIFALTVCISAYSTFGQTLCVKSLLPRSGKVDRQWTTSLDLPIPDEIREILEQSDPDINLGLRFEWKDPGFWVPFRSNAGELFRDNLQTEDLQLQGPPYSVIVRGSLDYIRTLFSTLAGAPEGIFSVRLAPDRYPTDKKFISESPEVVDHSWRLRLPTPEQTTILLENFRTSLPHETSFSPPVAALGEKLSAPLRSIVRDIPLTTPMTLELQANGTFRDGQAIALATKELGGSLDNFEHFGRVFPKIPVRSVLWVKLNLQQLAALLTAFPVIISVELKSGPPPGGVPL